MATITNNNLKMIDRPVWEQLTNTPASAAAAVACVDDGSRFIYSLFSVTAFYRYDTWADTWQQLANPPGGTLAAGSCFRYVTEMGSQVNGEVFGSVYALISSGTAVVFYRYDIGTNTWSAALSVANVPAVFGTDGRLHCPEPAINGFAGGYHSAVALNTITASAASIGATSITVSALPLALPANAVLNFGTVTAPIWAVTTAAAAASATSITVSALVAAVPAASVAYWYADMFLFGNNATVVYRYNIAANAWSTTSANSGTPAIAAVTAAPGTGMIACWLPGSGDTNALDRILLVRGGASATIYEYSLTGNSWSTLTYYPNTETFTTGSSSGVTVNSAGKSDKLIIQKEATGRCYMFDRKRLRIEPLCTQNLITPGAAVVGDKTAVIKDPSGAINFLYTMLNTSSYYMRTPLAY